jgi:DNA-binding Lrp family transcriptional regulator
VSPEKAPSPQTKLTYPVDLRVLASRMWTPDDLDLRIVRALASPHSFQWDVRISHARVAERVGVDEETVRSRLRRMNDVGFLERWQLIVNPGLLDREAAIVELRVGDQESKQESIARLMLLDGVILIDDLYGTELAVLTLYRGRAALERQVRLFGSLCGCRSPISWKLGFPPCELTLTRTDWRIIQALRREGRGRLADVARTLQLSTRTVKRRMLRMVEGNAFYLDPILNLGKVGGVRCRLLVTSQPNRKQAVDEAILSGLERIVSTNTAPKEFSLFVAHLSNVGEIQPLTGWVKALKGVTAVRATIEVEHIHVEPWLEGEIQSRVAPESN